MRPINVYYLMSKEGLILHYVGGHRFWHRPSFETLMHTTFFSSRATAKTFIKTRELGDIVKVYKYTMMPEGFR